MPFTSRDASARSASGHSASASHLSLYSIGEYSAWAEIYGAPDAVRRTFLNALEPLKETLVSARFEETPRGLFEHFRESCASLRNPHKASQDLQKYLNISAANIDSDPSMGSQRRRTFRKKS